MGSMMDMVMSQLSGSAMNQLGQILGGKDEQTTKAATQASLGALLGGLSRNAARPEGAESLSNALAKDHDGSLLNDLGGFLQAPERGPGAGILKHVLGSKQSRVETGISQATGIDKFAAGKLLATLAPVLMGALGKAKRESGLNPSDLASFLGQQRTALEQTEPKGMGLVGRLLDTDGDGDVDLSDIISHSSGFLGKMFGK